MQFHASSKFSYYPIDFYDKFIATYESPISNKHCSKAINGVNDASVTDEYIKAHPEFLPSLISK